jgi:hypothetical protein
MRTLTLLLLFMASLQANAQQTYTPFPMENAWWQYAVNSGSAGFWTNTDEQLMIVADKVTISNIEYNKLLHRSSYTSNATDPNATAPDAIADAADAEYAGIRESNKRVYIKFDGQPEMILFDFNLNVGDMMPVVKGMTNPTEQIYLKIDNIDNVTMGSTVRKRYHLEGGSTVVEGAGASFGLYRRESAVHVGISFRCSFDGSAYMAGSANPCDYIWPFGTPVTVAGVANPNPVGLYPNPCSDALHINGPTGLIAEVYDAVGRLVTRTPITKSINTSAWRDGLYIVKLYDANGELLKTEKVVKQ